MKKMILVVFPVALAGCMNMPTPTAQISGAYTSGMKYDGFACPQLVVEVDSLGRRETQLVTAQEQRVKTSQMQAFWLGFGQGDGIEASELAHVRGEREAVLKALQAKHCAVAPGVFSPITAPQQPPRLGNPGSTACSQGATRC